MKPGYVTAVLVSLGAAALIATFSRAQAEDSDSPQATYTRGNLHAAIPYSAPRAGEGVLTIEILNPEDGVVSRWERKMALAAGKGSWQADLKLDHAPATDELVWHRLRYRFRYTGDGQDAIQGTDSISQILRMPVVHVMAQQAYLSGAAAAVRVIVTDSKNEPIAGASTVRIELVASRYSRTRLCSAGRSTSAAPPRRSSVFRPALVGSYSLRYVVDTPIGSTEFTQPVRLEDKVSILLTTEKPIYQPGQTIHVRALALDRANHRAAADRNLTFEVEDSRGNKVFKKSAKTDAYGVASAEFGLADEVNLGTYHLRALMDGDGPAIPPNWR